MFRFILLYLMLLVCKVNWKLGLNNTKKSCWRWLWPNSRNVRWKKTTMIKMMLLFPPVVVVVQLQLPQELKKWKVVFSFLGAKKFWHSLSCSELLPCASCSKAFPLRDVIFLDACAHVFCVMCVRKPVNDFYVFFFW